VRNLWDNTRYFKKAVEQLGFDTGSSQTPIIPIIVGESLLAQTVSEKLFDKGIFAFPIVFPMVAKDKARIRTQMNAALTKDHLDKAINAFEVIGKELSII
jgi:glycine C-acetyltransferase